MPGGGGHDLVTLAPITQMGEVEVAPVGLVNMFNAGGAVRGFEVKESGEWGTGVTRQRVGAPFSISRVLLGVTVEDEEASCQKGCPPSLW